DGARCSTCAASPAANDPLAKLQNATTSPPQSIATARGRITESRHITRPPRIRMGATSVSGRVPPESIQYVVRLNFGRFRACYDEGLRRHPKLEGRVVTRFVIGADGQVLEAADAGSDLGDDEVAACVGDVFRSLTFPAPDSGLITVTYPIRFGHD